MYPAMNGQTFEAAGSLSVAACRKYERDPLGPRAVHEFREQPFVPTGNLRDVEAFFDPLPRRKTHRPSTFRAHLQHGAPGFCQGLRISRRHHDASLSDNESGIAYVGHDARNAAAHGLAHHVGEPFAVGGRERRNVQGGSHIGDIIITPPQQMALGSKTRVMDPLSEYLVFPGHLHPTEEEMHIRSVAMKQLRGPKKGAMVFLRIEAGDHADDWGVF